MGPTITLLWGPPDRPDADLKNAVVVSTGELEWERPETWTGAIDRSPCGTGTCAMMAALHARGRLPLGQDFRAEGILGPVFTGRLLRRAEVGGRAAVVPEITGTAWITGMARYVLDAEDPFPTGYTIGDIWGGGGRPPRQDPRACPNPPIRRRRLGPHAHHLAARLLRSSFMQPELHSLRCSAPDPDLAHLDTNSLAANRRIRA